jgi:dTDP-4-dehydrorhamnose 3,5-epimerase
MVIKMRILSVTPLALSGVAVVRFQRFRDDRGYFTEHFRKSDFDALTLTLGVRDLTFYQANESRSKKGVLRGLHFQWNPYMGKLVRTTLGRMVDIVLDLRKSSPTLGNVIFYDMPFDPEADYQDWIWVPVGFAHGNFFTEESSIEYFCTGEWNPDCEAGLSPLSSDLSFEEADAGLREEFFSFIKNEPLMSSKDRNAPNLKTWLSDPRSEVFGEAFWRGPL